MTQGNYISEYTQDLMRRQQVAGGVPVLDLTNWQAPRYMSGDSQMRSLPPPVVPCHMIEVKTTVDGQTDKCPILVDSSIIICTTDVIGSCPVTETNCPTGGTIATTQYVNFIATFTMGANQNGVKIIFKYVKNGTPMQETVTVNVVAGDNYVYAFAANQLYPADTILVLYGAEVLA
jgi:hypothetical protein